MIVRYLTILGMLVTIAWFLWNPDGWVFQWDPIVVFIFSLAGFIASDINYSKKVSQQSTKNKDSELFNNFFELIPSNGVIEFLKNHDFIRPFDSTILNTLTDFVYYWDNAEHTFFDKKVENKKLEFYVATNKLLQNIAQFTYPNANGRQSVIIDELKYNDKRKNRFDSQAKIINDSADEVYKIHQEFITLGRKRL